MAIAKSSGGDFTPAPAGTHPARCIGQIALGTQHSQMFPDSFKVMLMWELPDCLVEVDGQKAPMTISKEYTLSLNEKANLRRDLVSWRGRDFTDEESAGFDVAKVVGAPCFLNVIHKTSAKGKTYANIAGVMPLPKKQQPAEQWHKSVKYEIEQGRDDVFKSLPEWIQKKIAACNEWTMPSVVEPAQPTTHSNEEPETDDVPF